MTPRELHDGCEDGLTPLVSLDLGKVEFFSGLVRAMKATAFGRRRLGEALDIFLEMTRDPDCLVDVLVTTGAIVANGLSESTGDCRRLMGGNATSRPATNTWVWTLSLSPSHCPSYGLGDSLVRYLESLSDNSVVQARLM